MDNFSTLVIYWLYNS